MEFKIPQETKVARVIQVIETVTLAGDGTDANPVYEVFQYWTLDGKLLAKNDPISQPGKVVGAPTERSADLWHAKAIP